MKITSISWWIMKVLKDDKKWMWGGTLEKDVSRMTVHKASSVSRIARMLAEEGKIKVDYKKVKGVRRPCVMYRCL